MITLTLPRPRNPPYRSPTPRNTPPRDPDASASPKRKRTEQSPAKSDSWCVNTAAFQRDMTPETGANSPRTKVAERLQDLDIRSAPSQDGELPSSSQSPRKRLKRDPRLREVFHVSAGVCTPGNERPLLEVPESVATVEVAETPVAHEHEANMSPSPPVSPTKALKFFQKAPQDVSHVPTSSPPAQRPFSPSLFTMYQPDPSTSTKARDEHAAMAIDIPLPQSSASEDLDLAALTWQESEITGHEIDPTSPDDDGEGINGLGFRPTAAIAYVRSQKRRKAVEEWKAREAREARARRMQRRNRGSSDPVRPGGEADAEGRRSVRFVGVG